MEYDFLPATENAANCNDLVNQHMSNGVRRHKHLKCCFSIADPRIHPHPKTVQPDFKVDAFFDNVKKISLSLVSYSTFDTGRVGSKAHWPWKCNYEM